MQALYPYSVIVVIPKNPYPPPISAVAFKKYVRERERERGRDNLHLIQNGGLISLIPHDTMLNLSTICSILAPAGPILHDEEEEELVERPFPSRSSLNIESGSTSEEGTAILLSTSFILVLALFYFAIAVLEWRYFSSFKNQFIVLHVIIIICC